MNAPLRPATIDRTLARMMAPLDTEPGFDSRLRARLARERLAPDAATRAKARERALAERRAALATLRRRFVRQVASVALAAAAAAIPAWLLGPVVGRALMQLASGAGPIGIVSVSVAALALTLWRSFEPPWPGVPRIVRDA